MENIILLIIPWVLAISYSCVVHGAEEGCNEYVCGSVVSKCLLTQSCQCKLSDCYCCKDCLNCLGELYSECCGCLDMCPKFNDTLSALTPKSQIGDFEGVAELFETLTADDDDEEWTVIRFPMRATLRRLSTNVFSSSSSNSRKGDGIDQHLDRLLPASLNCTVIYLNACTSNKKCAQYCESMGSNSYRWFHDGCCECVGANCYNYGINESQCSKCPEEEEDDGANDGLDGGDDDFSTNAEEDDMMWDYGEDEVRYN